jgi:hypothetical protein
MILKLNLLIFTERGISLKLALRKNLVSFDLAGIYEMEDVEDERERFSGIFGNGRWVFMGAVVPPVIHTRTADPQGFREALATEPVSIFVGFGNEQPYFHRSFIPFAVI